jgi:hypothetical protein
VDLPVSGEARSTFHGWLSESCQSATVPVAVAMQGRSGESLVSGFGEEPAVEQVAREWPVSPQTRSFTMPCTGSRRTAGFGKGKQLLEGPRLGRKADWGTRLREHPHSQPCSENPSLRIIRNHGRSDYSEPESPPLL